MPSARSSSQQPSGVPRDLYMTNPTGDEPVRELQYDRRNGHRGAARAASVRGTRIAQCNETESAHCEKETNNVFVMRRSGRPAARQRGGGTRRHGEMSRGFGTGSRYECGVEAPHVTSFKERKWPGA